jgi:hypothetical protein
MKIVLLEVDPNPNGAWDPDTETECGVFDSREAAISFSRESLQAEGFDIEEINQMPVAGSHGSRFQFRELND